MRDSVDFEDRIYAKSAIAPILRRELKRLDPGTSISIGTATDPYQPAERRFHRTREALQVFAEQSGLALSITTNRTSSSETSHSSGKSPNAIP